MWPVIATGSGSSAPRPMEREPGHVDAASRSIRRSRSWRRGVHGTRRPGPHRSHPLGDRSSAGVSRHNLSRQRRLARTAGPIDGNNEGSVSDSTDGVPDLRYDLRVKVVVYRHTTFFGARIGSDVLTEQFEILRISASFWAISFHYLTCLQAREPIPPELGIHPESRRAEQLRR